MSDAPTANGFFRRDRAPIAVIVLLGLALRLLAATLAVTTNGASEFNRMHGDTSGYLRLAGLIEEGKPWNDGDARDQNRALVRPPGYPALLALVDQVPGVDVRADARPIVWVQALASTLAIPLAYFVARRVFLRRSIALVAATLVALSPTAVAACAIAMPDGLHGTLFGASVGALLLLARGRIRPRWRTPIALAGGVALAAAISLKPASMYWPIVTVALMAGSLAIGRRTVREALLLAAPGLLVVGLWTWHNRAEFGVATYSTVAARNLRWDLAPRVEFLAAKGRFPKRAEYERAAKPATDAVKAELRKRSVSQAAIDRRMRDETRRILFAHPRATLRVALDNLAEGAMRRWQRSDAQFRGESPAARAMRWLYERTGSRDLRRAWYAILLAAWPIAMLSRERRVATTVALVALLYVHAGLITIPSEGTRLLAGAELPAALLAATTVDFLYRVTASVARRHSPRRATP